MADMAFALVLNLHQPAGNLEDLLVQREWEAREILWAMDRIPRSLWAYEDVGRVHLSLSGTLLETLASPGFQRRVYGIVDCGSLLWYLQNTTIIRILGTGYYHPVLPLIPHADWDEQLERWQGIGRHLFARTSFPGFWPPEMGFCMELIPALNRYGYRYVLVDSEHVERGHPHGLGRTALSPAHRPVRRRGNHRRGPGPGAVRRPGGRDGRRLVHSRGGPADQALRLPAPGHHLHRRGQRRLVPQHLAASQLLARLLPGPAAAGTGQPKRRHPSLLHRGLPRPPRRPRRGHRAPGRVEHRLARRHRLHPVDRLAGPAAGPDPPG